ncbi:MAG: hypothetical protein V3571_04440 [Pseudodesulfovibrio sp.]
MRIYSRHIRNIALLATLMLGGVAAVNAVFDPYQVFHDQFQSPVRYSTNHRFQAPGLIRILLKPGTGYDSVIIGTSMTQNFRPSEVSSLLGWGKTVPLSVSGGSAEEIRLVLGKALDTGDVKHALVGIFNSYSEQAPALDVGVFPLYLYGGCPAKYFFNFSTLRAVFEAYLGRGSNWVSDLDTYNLWTQDRRSYNSEANMARFRLKLEKTGERRDPGVGRLQGFPAFDEQLLRLIKAHPDTQFLCFFPPYSLYYFAAMSKADFEHIMDFYEHVIEAISQTPNARIFGFDTCFDFTGNLANYSDETHYRAAMNSAMLGYMAAGRHRLTPGNWPEYRRQLTQAAGDYRLKSDFDAAGAWAPGL